MIAQVEKEKRAQITFERRLSAGRPVLCKFEEGECVEVSPMVEVKTSPVRDRYFREAQEFIKTTGAAQW